MTRTFFFFTIKIPTIFFFFWIYPTTTNEPIRGCGCWINKIKALEIFNLIYKSKNIFRFCISRYDFPFFLYRETFPYYKSWDDRWKNSVRHNLSINPYFRKGTKARQGSGHLWTVNRSDDNSKINSWASKINNLMYLKI